ncbi:MAG: hypothetical protein ABII71_03335 [Candidatus Micrarchaeota archaeon]
MNTLEKTIEMLEKGDLRAESDALGFLGSEAISQKDRNRLSSALVKALNSAPPRMSVDEIMQGLNDGELTAVDQLMRLRMNGVDKILFEIERGAEMEAATKKSAEIIGSQPGEESRNAWTVNALLNAIGPLMAERDTERLGRMAGIYFGAASKLNDKEVETTFIALGTVATHTSSGNQDIEQGAVIAILRVAGMTVDILDRKNVGLNEHNQRIFVEMAKKSLAKLVTTNAAKVWEAPGMAVACEALGLFEGKEVEDALRYVIEESIDNKAQEAAKISLDIVQSKVEGGYEEPEVIEISGPDAIVERKPKQKLTLDVEGAGLVKTIYQTSVALLTASMGEDDEMVAVKMLGSFVKREGKMKDAAWKIPVRTADSMDTSAIAALLKTAVEGRPNASAAAIEALTYSKAATTERTLRKIRDENGQEKRPLIDMAEKALSLRQQISTGNMHLSMKLPPPMPRATGAAKPARQKGLSS